MTKVSDEADKETLSAGGRTHSVSLSLVSGVPMGRVLHHMPLQTTHADKASRISSCQRGAHDRGVWWTATDPVLVQRANSDTPSAV